MYKNEVNMTIIFVGYSSNQELISDIELLDQQKNLFNFEVIVLDLQKNIDIDFVKSKITYKNLINMCVTTQESSAILLAQGKYIAIRRAGDLWRIENKLAQQIDILENDLSCVLVMHDIELLKENDCPIDQDLRNKFIKYVGFDNHIYGIKELQKFKSSSYFGTWVFRNIFKNEREKELFEKFNVELQLRLLAILVANGICKNLAYNRLIACYPDMDILNKKIQPSYSSVEAVELIEETNKLKEILDNNYNIKINNYYRMMSITNGLLNYIASNQSETGDTKFFIEKFNYIKNAVNNLPDELDEEEKVFYEFLQRKIWKYVTKNSDDSSAQLIQCLDISYRNFWISGIKRCKSSKNKNILKDIFDSRYPECKEMVSNSNIFKENIVSHCSKIKKKPKKVLNKCKYLMKKIITLFLRKRGYSSYMANEWYETVKDNLFNDKVTPLKVKFWCYRNGFMPWRIVQYGINKNNPKEFLSDRDYMYLHQINNSYKKWIEDKMTLRLVLEPFKENLPKYYYQIIQRDDKQIIIPLSDCPDGYEATFDELLRLLREKGKLALKAASGTHGVGFYKLEFENGFYFLNNEKISEYGIKKVIDSFKSFYIVTEYINMHNDIKNIFSGSVNTIRVMMINRDGHHPELMDAYMRIGTKKSGVTDNVAFGGVVCSVNLKNGEFGNGLQLKNHSYVSIDTHPDTGAPLKGVLPHWELIKKGLINISKYLAQLEYLGFDVVCTPSGFVILEINSHQDLHRLPSYSQTVRDFFAYKLRRKEKRYKINR